jgi:hypothetical protein
MIYAICNMYIKVSHRFRLHVYDIHTQTDSVLTSLFHS